MANLVLGINAYHGDSSAALFADGELVAAAEEERFRRIKHWAGFPTQAIAACLREADARLDQVRHIATNSDPGAHRWRKIGYVLTRNPDPRMVFQRLRMRRKRRSLSEDLARNFPGHSFTGQLHRVEHHLCHLASAFLVSPFDRAVAVSVDGFGDFASAAWGEGVGTSLDLDGHVFFPHSLGIFYLTLTQFLGFHRYGDEYKVMGLAAYGKPVYVERLHQVLRARSDGGFTLGLDYFRYHRELIDFRSDEREPTLTMLFSPELERLLGPARQPSEPLEQRHRDLAASVQAVYEQRFFALLNAIHARYRNDALCLAGGCAMNSLANGRIAQCTPFRRVYIQAAAGDAGGAIGAAAIVASRSSGRRPQPMSHAYWGPGYAQAEIAALLASRKAALEAQACRVSQDASPGELCRRVARHIADGCVVGWFHGRMEWGPRALGNRSILGDPRRADMKDILNLKIKRRESFRPFAPSILREHVREWFEQDGDVPFMMQVYSIRPDKRAVIPAVTHVDGTGRLQTVTAESNPLYYRLISEFHTLTGVPMVLNTSFNENEPVVCQPVEALDCFLRTKMDVLVLGQAHIQRVASGTG